MVVGLASSDPLVGDPHVRVAIDGVRERSRWEHADEPFFEGEDEPCINGGAVGLGAYFGEDVDGAVTRLLPEQLADGGWNCETESGSTRATFHSTICVLEGLAEYERAGGAIPVVGARQRAQEYLLTRRLFRRASTGEVVDPEWLMFSSPVQWHYDVLRGLDYFRRLVGTPDPRLRENTNPGLVHFEMEQRDEHLSRWNTLRALRVLRWYETAGS